MATFKESLSLFSGNKFATSHSWSSRVLFKSYLGAGGRGSPGVWLQGFRYMAGCQKLLSVESAAWFDWDYFVFYMKRFVLSAIA